MLYTADGKKEKGDENMGLLTYFLTKLIMGEERGVNYEIITRNSREQRRHDELMEEMKREHQERMAMESQRRR